MHLLLFGRFRDRATIRDAWCSDLALGKRAVLSGRALYAGRLLLGLGAMSEWEFGETACCHAMMDEGISVAKELNDKNALAIGIYFAANLAANERNPAEVDRLASDLIELSTRQNFAHW